MASKARLSPAALALPLVIAFLLILLLRPPSLPGPPPQPPTPRRRLSSSSSSPIHTDLPHVLSLATRLPHDQFTQDGRPLRLLFIVTTLSEYDKGTRGTTHGADRLKDLVLPLLVDGVSSMVERGWHVDVYLICGFETLLESRREMIRDALPDGVGLEVWEDAIPLYYEKKFNQQLKREDQSVEMAPHGLSRQHRYVVRDKLMEYDFFTAFEDDMRIMADHVVNFLEMSVEIDRLRQLAESAPDGKVYVENAIVDRRTVRGKSQDKATVGNDVVEDPLTVEDLKRLWPGFVRAEVLDATTIPNHPLLTRSAIDNYKWKENVPPSFEYEKEWGTIDPNVCCNVPPGRARTPPHPQKDDLLLWETDISAMGVRHYPGGIGWAAAMTVEDRADIGSYWSGEENVFQDPTMIRPRRVNSLIGQQAGWMASRSQILYFHEHACPGGFLPPFDGEEWYNDSLQTRNGAVEFWSGGYQLFGRCYFNRILSMNPKRFSRQLLYHGSNNKQRTVNTNKFVRFSHFLGQLYTVKERAIQSLNGEQ
ncbi:hypothetical protein HJC23_009921 [Cyclotella cryptica]|uniref:Uncharacterized protein n=1 Tax=Cyclotella cryptica TaxID=29204 RepID=A0ABD3P1Q5_9STRA|eukprot:CCRYP_018309-RA/>CCRYP_018309-RA protein AED:0.33 eAED:0.33 QI:0/-1/0/1/-1/1/1/0/534